jgi:hypothetical protein
MVDHEFSRTKYDHSRKRTIPELLVEYSVSCAACQYRNGEYVVESV